MLPLTRDENWLAMIAGDPDADESMIPRTRKEYFLKEIADNQGGGGGGGAGGGVLVANVIVTGEDPDQTISLDKTWQEIADAVFCVIRSTEETEETSYVVFECVQRVGTESGTYIVASSNSAFATDSPNGYPVWGINITIKGK